MLQEPKITVITVCLNDKSTVEDTILSVTSQTHRPLEYIVVDGDSTDGTKDILEKYRDRMAVLISERDRGIYHAMNKGLARATGDIVGFLNADDVYTDTSVLAQVAKALADRDVEACYADLVYVSKSNSEKVVRYWKSKPYEPGSFKRGWMIAHPTFFVRRSVYERLGGFDPAYRLQADFELAMRFLEIHRIRSVYVPRIWVRFRTGGESNKHLMNVIRGNIEAYRACRKHGMNVTLFFIVRKILLRLPQFLFRSKRPSDMVKQNRI